MRRRDVLFGWVITLAALVFGRRLLSAFLDVPPPWISLLFAGIAFFLVFQMERWRSPSSALRLVGQYAVGAAAVAGIFAAVVLGGAITYLTMIRLGHIVPAEGPWLGVEAFVVSGAAALAIWRWGLPLYRSRQRRVAAGNMPGSFARSRRFYPSPAPHHAEPTQSLDQPAHSVSSPQPGTATWPGEGRARLDADEMIRRLGLPRRRIIL